MDGSMRTWPEAEPLPRLRHPRRPRRRARPHAPRSPRRRSRPWRSPSRSSSTAGSTTRPGRLATPGTGFVQREPDTGQPASQDTEVRVLYTPKVLYIGLDLRDSEPERVISKEMQRDEPLWRDDAVDVVLDTFDDDRNAYLFETNPNGARTDAMITDEGRSFNLQWDGVWDVAARRTPNGWSAELAIPFSTLRFDPAAEAWGFNVLRYIRRRAEQAFWAPILLDGDVKRVSLYGRLTGPARHRAGPEPEREALRPRLRQQGRRPRDRPQEERPRLRSRRQVGRHPRAEPRPDREDRLRRDRGGRAAGEPHALPALLPGEALLLPGERRHLRLRPERRDRDGHAAA